MPIIFNNISSRYPKEEIEKCVNDVFFEVFNYKNRIDSKKSFIKAFLLVIKKRKVIDVYGKNILSIFYHIL